ncbi:hypothetical protein GSI_08313 [Ganoderma sinense ZZ0214-1]|uniref:Alcohol acetyltransferase n=1 Tax=Ganoderma sinense ZZ0214-1 TaxID=1077348 RepID=A0A2G8S6Y0_9APHY|nr:hypothetical protein GSI_08313 [Ganoderma sinense ZZ0214-1]
MSGPEPGWEQHPSRTGAYTRSLLASEIWTDQSARFNDGLSQFAIGVQLTTTIHERDIEARLKEAVIRLRFDCPLIAATIERGLHHADFGSWVYAPPANVEAARDWADKVVHYLRDPIDSESFLQSTVETHKIPYVLADGFEQLFRVYLTRPDSTLNTYLLSVHTSHSVLDAKPGLNALSLLLEFMSTPGSAGIDELAWGTEHKNLPPGPITVTGGPREDWGTKGTAMVDKFLSAAADQTPSHGLDCDTSVPRTPGKAHRLLVKFTTGETAKITRALKTLGFTFSELIDAAAIVAAFEHKPVPADEVDTTRVNGASLIAITDRLPPTVDRRRHLVSCMVYTPYRILYAPLAPLTGKARLLAAMRQAKEQYDAWLAEPCLPHLIAALAPQISPNKPAQPPPPGRGVFAPTMTNVGRVENYVALGWPRGAGAGDSEEVVVRVDGMHIACRMGSVWYTPTVHMWSVQGRLSVLLQGSAADVWDRDVLQDFISGIVKQISFIMEE